MRKTEVGKGMFVIDNESGINGAHVVPPNPRDQAHDPAFVVDQLSGLRYPMPPDYIEPKDSTQNDTSMRAKGATAVENMVANPEQAGPYTYSPGSPEWQHGREFRRIPGANF